MALTGRLHPLLVHFPIALVLIAAVAETVAIVAGIKEWHVVAVANVRAGAAFAVGAAMAGWLLALAPGIDASPTLEWHRWFGTLAATGAVAAALATAGLEGRSLRALWIYRMTLFGAAAAVAVTGHFGGVLVWGANFLRP
jgi:uncharacterized membrane protein